ncbi:hypothetical protein Tco_1135287 [Tanacetum coccineum]
MPGKKGKPTKKPVTPVKKVRPVKKGKPIRKSVSFSPNVIIMILNSGEGYSRDGEVCSRDAENHQSHQNGLKIKSLHPEHNCSRNYKLEVRCALIQHLESILLRKDVHVDRGGAKISS